MTKQEYNSAKQEIIKLQGKPEYDYDRTPLNDSAKSLSTLHGKYLADCRANKQQNKQSNEVDIAVKPLQTLAEAIPETVRKQHRSVPLPEIVVLDKDLKGFTSVQASILRDHFMNLDLEPKTLANKYGQSYQFVAGLLKSKEVQFLRTKYFNEILNVETMKSILRAVKAGDSRTLEGATEYLKLMTNNTDANLGSKPIEDLEAEKKLKELGDTLAGA